MLKFELGNVPYYYLGSNQQQLLIQTKKNRRNLQNELPFFFLPISQSLMMFSRQSVGKNSHWKTGNRTTLNMEKKCYQKFGSDGERLTTADVGGTNLVFVFFCFFRNPFHCLICGYSFLEDIPLVLFFLLRRNYIKFSDSFYV